MYTTAGHLVFETSSSYNISFVTGNSGRVNFNSRDVTELISQVSRVDMHRKAHMKLYMTTYTFIYASDKYWDFFYYLFRFSCYLFNDERASSY